MGKFIYVKSYISYVVILKLGEVPAVVYLNIVKVVYSCLLLFTFVYTVVYKC